MLTQLKHSRKSKRKVLIPLILEGKKDKETSSQWEDVESFFSIFRNENLEDPEADADAGQEEEEADFLREDFFPYALNYYLNIMPMEDDEGSFEEGEDDDQKGPSKGNQEGKEKCKNQ
jgi:hypothetical protein